MRNRALRKIVGIVALLPPACGGRIADEEPGTGAGPSPVETAEVDAPLAQIDGTARAHEACKLYWLRLQGKEPTPDIPPVMVSRAVESLAAYAPSEGARFVAVAVPGGLDEDGQHVPHPDYVDPWGTKLSLELHSGARARVVSAGPDRELGTEDDLGFPSEPEAIAHAVGSSADDPAPAESGSTEDEPASIPRELSVFLGLVEGDSRLTAVCDCSADTLRAVFSASGQRPSDGLILSGVGTQSFTLDDGVEIRARGTYGTSDWSVEISAGGSVTFESGNHYRFDGEGWVLQPR